MKHKLTVYLFLLLIALPVTIRSQLPFVEDFGDGTEPAGGHSQVIGKLEVLVMLVTLLGIHPRQLFFIGILLLQIILNE